MIKRWVCSECGDLIESGCTHPPRVCEICNSILSFNEITNREKPLAEVRPVRVTRPEDTAA